jgi:hypothetical protein
MRRNRQWILLSLAMSLLSLMLVLMCFLDVDVNVTVSSRFHFLDLGFAALVAADDVIVD